MASLAAGQTRQGWHSVLVGGIATFLGAPLVEQRADAIRAAGARVAFVGMPFDSTTIARPGAQLGVRAVRDWSSHLLSYHGEYDIDLFEALGLVDTGDVAVVPANAPKTVDLVADAMGEALKAGAMPLLCGGEHITTIGGSLAVDRYAPGSYGLVLMDTHLDTAPHVGGETINHCCPITRAMELQSFDPARCVIIGPHGAMNPKSEYAYVREAGVTVFHVSDVDRYRRGLLLVRCRLPRQLGGAGHLRSHDGRPDVARGFDDGVCDRHRRPGCDGCHRDRARV
jgi:agmatinase